MAGEPLERYAAARAAMVERQLRGRGIRDERVLDAMGRLEREAFVRPDLRGRAYDDSALPLAVGQSISQPYVVARMTELLAPRAGDRVLEVGTGSGYQAGVLALLGCRVVSYERHAELAEDARRHLSELGLSDLVEVRLGDGSRGDSDGAPWPRIIVTAAAPGVPGPLREQLDEAGGRLVVPVGSRWEQRLLLVVRNGDEWEERSEGFVVFVPLVGEAGFRTD